MPISKCVEQLFGLSSLVSCSLSRINTGISRGPFGRNPKPATATRIAFFWDNWCVSERSALTDLIRRGRRRQIRHLLVHEASLSAALALGGAILLLVAGTQILNWYWP